MTTAAATAWLRVSWTAGTGYPHRGRPLYACRRPGVVTPPRLGGDRSAGIRRDHIPRPTLVVSVAVRHPIIVCAYAAARYFRPSIKS